MVYVYFLSQSIKNCTTTHQYTLVKINVIEACLDWATSLILSVMSIWSIGGWKSLPVSARQKYPVFYFYLIWYRQPPRCIEEKHLIKQVHWIILYNCSKIHGRDLFCLIKDHVVPMICLVKLSETYFNQPVALNMLTLSHCLIILISNVVIVSVTYGIGLWFILLMHWRSGQYLCTYCMMFFSIFDTPFKMINNFIFPKYLSFDTHILCKFFLLFYWFSSKWNFR